MMDWLHTLRWKNILIIWISVLVVISPHYDFANTHLFDEFIRWAIICSCIAAIGNITNDWMDVKQDKENKKKNIFTRKDQKNKAILLILLLFVCAILTSLFSQLQAIFSMMAFTALSLLLLYNLVLKKIALIGNLVIAFLTALIFIGIDLITTSRLVYYEMGFDNKQIELLALFAFLTTLVREILKDAEDRKGDLFAGFHTIAKFLKDQWIAMLIICIGIAGCIGIYFLMALRQHNFIGSFYWYAGWTLSVCIGSAICMLIPHPSRYVRATRIVKAGMLGCLAIYLFLSL
jgi:4-hydroxybenzoate polyprenyltransferase